jgi:hypothetical protein
MAGLSIITVPAGTEAAQCPRGCGMEIYWVERRRATGPGTVRIPIECGVLGGATPDSLSCGRGVNHFELCESEDE